MMRTLLFQLGEEMREAFEGTPYVFKDSIVRSRETAAADLEAAHEPRLPPPLYGDQHHVVRNMSPKQSPAKPARTPRQRGEMPAVLPRLHIEASRAGRRRNNEVEDRFANTNRQH